AGGNLGVFVANSGDQRRKLNAVERLLQKLTHSRTHGLQQKVRVRFSLRRASHNVNRRSKPGQLLREGKVQFGLSVEVRESEGRNVLRVAQLGRLVRGPFLDVVYKDCLRQ